MYKVTVKFSKSGNTYEIYFATHEPAKNYCKTLKRMRDIDYTIDRLDKIPVTKEERYLINDNALCEFTDHIMNRFTRRD